MTTEEEKAFKYFTYLADRWRDEAKWDFAEYRAAMAMNLPPGATLETMTKRPFRVVYVGADGTRRWIKVTAEQFQYGGYA